jgi:predicted  nucleic acid-binding Zn-ribbon protein
MDATLTLDVPHRIRELRCTACGRIDRDGRFGAGCPDCGSNGHSIEHYQWIRVYPNGGSDNGKTAEMEPAVNTAA